MQFFGVVFIVSTLVVLFLKHEDLNDTSHIATNEHLTFAQTYGVILRILNLKYVRKLIFIIFTCKVIHIRMGNNNNNKNQDHAQQPT